MRVQPFVSSALLLLSVSTAIAGPVSNPDAKKKPPSKHSPESDSTKTVAEALATDNPQTWDFSGPFDGKDGKPHAGPFVETSAERDRKKSQNGSKMKDEEDDTFSENTEHIAPDGTKIPHSNDGVMDDKNRSGPKEGTTGTEGGVSEKSKGKDTSGDRKPDPPKEAPPLPHSEQKKIPGQDDQTENYEDDKKGSTVLEKPDDLPESPHSISSGKSDKPLGPGISTKPGSPQSPGTKTPTGAHNNEFIHPSDSFFLSLTMIIFSEIGDKTFLVAALMAMRHPRMLVFSAAFSALAVMTVLSAILGHAVPTILPAHFTSALASVLFFVFGCKMMLEARNMAPDENVSQEMKEVEMELEEKEHEQRRMGRNRSGISAYALESGHGGLPRKSRSSNHILPSPESLSSSSSRDNSPSRSNTLANVTSGVSNLFSFLLSPAWVQTFVMTFLGEWGDRSQIATIAMAAGADYWWVTCGAVIGHGLCTAGAVIGGRAIAGKVSIRVVTFGGAVTFLIFGLLYLFESIY
ncbi:GCR1-dependent translation factor 1 [Microsporum audouinii]